MTDPHVRGGRRQTGRHVGYTVTRARTAGARTHRLSLTYKSHQMRQTAQVLIIHSTSITLPAPVRFSKDSDVQLTPSAGVDPENKPSCKLLKYNKWRGGELRPRLSDCICSVFT